MHGAEKSYGPVDINDIGSGPPEMTDPGVSAQLERGLWIIFGDRYGEVPGVFSIT